MGVKIASDCDSYVSGQVRKRPLSRSLTLGFGHSEGCFQLHSSTDYVTSQPRGPRPFNPVLRCVSLMPTAGPHQGAPVQDAQRLLYGALREASLLRDLAMAEPYPLLALTDGAPPQEEVHDEGSRTVVMAHEVPEEHVDNILVEAKGSHVSIVLKRIVTFKRLYRHSAPVAWSEPEGVQTC